MSSAFPVIYDRDVKAAVGFVGLRRDGTDLGIVHESSPRQMIGQSMGDAPRFELFVYVENVNASLDAMRNVGVSVLREAEDMPWGERIAFVADPAGNPVTLAAPTSS